MADNNLSTILAALKGVKRQGSGYQALCPAHKDGDPSLSVNEGQSGKVLLYCHAGCTWKEIVEAAGLDAKSLFPGNTSSAAANGHGDHGRVVKRTPYRYLAADGQTYIKLRLDYEDGYKACPWYTEEGFKSHKAGLNGYPIANMLLYGHEEISKLDEKVPIILAEGEKATDALKAHGFVATTLAGGAAQKQFGSALAPLANHPVYLWPDNDDEGRALMHNVAANLVELGAAVHWLEPAGAAVHKGNDAYDYFARAGTADNIEVMVKFAPLWERPEKAAAEPTKAPEGNAHYSVVCMADVVAEPVHWLWQDFLARGKFGLWEGDPGVGKTFALLAACSALTRGYGLPGMEQSEPRNVLFLTMEDDLADTIRPRLDAMGADLNRFFASDDMIQIDTEGIAFLEEQLAVIKPVLMVIDPIMAYIPGNVDIYKPNQIRKITSPLRNLAQKYDCAIVGIRHLTKAQKDRAIYRGAGGMDFVGASRLVVLVGRDPNDEKKRAIVQTKTNLGGQGRSVGYTIEDGQFFWAGQSDLTADQILAASTFEEDKSAVDEAVEFLSECLKDKPLPSNEVFKEADSIGVKQPTLRLAKKRLGVVVSRHGKEGVRGGGVWLWALPRTQAQGDAA